MKWLELIQYRFNSEEMIQCTANSQGLMMAFRIRSQELAAIIPPPSPSAPRSSCPSEPATKCWLPAEPALRSWKPSMLTLPAADSTWPLSQLLEADSKHSQLTGTDAIQNQRLRADSSKNQLTAADSKWNRLPAGLINEEPTSRSSSVPRRTPTWADSCRIHSHELIKSLTTGAAAYSPEQI